MGEYLAAGEMRTWSAHHRACVQNLAPASTTPPPTHNNPLCAVVTSFSVVNEVQTKSYVWHCSLVPLAQVSTLVRCVQDQAQENQAARAAVAAAEAAAASAIAAAAAAPPPTAPAPGAGAGAGSSGDGAALVPKARRSGVTNQLRKLLLAPTGEGGEGASAPVTRGVLEDRIRTLLGEADVLRMDLEVRVALQNVPCSEAFWLPHYGYVGVHSCSRMVTGMQPNAAW